MKFRKKPVVIEAMQWTIDNAQEMLDFLNCDDTHIFDYTNCFYIETLEGRMLASPKDWIIKGVEGKFYPCKPGIFAKTYEAVAEESLDAGGADREGA